MAPATFAQTSVLKAIVCTNKLSAFAHNLEAAEIQTCQKRGRTWSHRKTFTFDAAILQNNQASKATLTNEPCWDEPERTFVKVETSPDFISFNTGSESFSIDRKTLSASYLGLSYTCSVRDVPREKNKI